MYLVLRRDMVFGVFSSKKIAKMCMEAVIQSDYEKTGTYGWYHFRYIKFDVDEPWLNKDNKSYNAEIGRALFSLSTLHTEYFKEIENDPHTGKILKF